MKKLNLFLLVAGFFVFSSCTERLEHNEEKSSGNVVINLSSVNAERGAVPAGYSSVDISKVKEWKLTFSLVPPFDEFPDEVRTIKDKSGAVTIGVGQYDLLVEGSYTESRDTGDFIYKLSGARSGIVVEEGNKNTVPVSVLVGPKKTTEGKGSFSATMTFMQGKLNTYYYETIGLSPNALTDEKSKRFKAELVSRKTGEIVYSTHSGEKLLVAVADTGDSSVTVKSAQIESEPNKISSGYYYFRFYADFAPVKLNDPSAEITPVWKEVSIGDNLVEIGDGLLTPMTCKSLSFENTTYRYYASDKGSEENNGISQDAPGELYTVLDTIYSNPMVQNAKINYTYSDKMEFDVSKVQSGKQVTISYNKNGSGDSYSFTIDEKGLTTFYNMNEELSLITTNDKVKSFNVKEINSSIKVCLNNGVYLDFSSFKGNEQQYLQTIYFDVDDVEYYKKNPIVVSSESFNKKLSFDSPDVSSDSFTYDIIVENSADSSHKYYYAEEPVSPIVYYSNKYSEGYPVQYWIQYKENNTSGYNDSFSLTNESSLAAFCDDYNGGLYTFEFKLEGENENIVPNSPTSGYELVHFVREKTGKPKFILEKKNTRYIKQQIPASMCTDGSRLYFVNTAATISEKNGQELSLSSWDHWAYENAIVYSVDGNSGQSASEVQLNFGSVFTKVTAVYCQGKNKDLYIAGYKTNQNGSTKDSTYCIYKLANPQNYTTNCSITAEELTKVSGLFTTSEDSSFKNWCNNNKIEQNVYAFNAITDMAIIDDNLYVLKNSYYYFVNDNIDNTNITSSLIRINNNGQIDKTWSTADYNGQTNPFMVARKFIAVLPKKKKFLISENASSCYYTGDFSNGDLNIVSMFASGYAFDGYDITPRGFISGTNFRNEADFIEKVSSN